LSKPHDDEGTLVVNIVNPTAGLLAGDRVRYDVAVESGARVLLTAPSASRAHRIVEGDARMAQEFHVAAAAGWRAGRRCSSRKAARVTGSRQRCA